MARHRSPQGRRAHLGPPLHAVMASAGVGGVGRSLQLRRLSPSPLILSASPPIPPRSLPARLVATAVAGGVLAAAGQHALADSLPAAADGANVLRLGVSELLGLPVATAPDPALSAGEGLVTVSPVAVDPAVADATDLVKAAELQRLAAEADARAAEAARVAENARARRAAADRVAGSPDAERPGGVPTPAAAEAPPTAAPPAPPPAAPPAARPAAPPAAAPPAAPPASPPAAAPAAAPAGGAVQVVVGRVSSGFGLRGGSQHQGLDIAAPIGTPIRVPLDGTVIDSGPASGFGLWVRVRHADGTITVYGHINRSLVTVGQRVSAGQVIAEVGNRGQSTGPHLHIEVITPAGIKIDPRPWLADRGTTY